MATLISIFPNLKDSQSPKYADVYEALRRIWDGNSRHIVEPLRAATDKAERERLKRSLPCVCFSGRFTRRANESLVTHSGLLCLDFDHLPDPLGAKSYLSGLPYMMAVWISPSGTGVKALVRIPANPTAHRGHFASLEKEMAEIGMDIDASGKDVARICFESYDPDLFYNPDATEYTGYLVPEETPPPPPQPAATDFGKLNACANMIRKAADGQKHEVLLKAARLAGGYVAAGIVGEADAVRVLEEEIRTKPGLTDFRQAQRTIQDGLRYGKEKPIYEQTAEEQPAQKSETTHGVVYLSSVWNNMQHQYHNGKSRGEPTGLDALDKHFTWKAGDLTLVSGRPNSGKSEFIMQLMLYKSFLSGWKWAVFSPENYPAEEFYDTLIHALVGKSVDKCYANLMSPGQYEEAANFVHEHFFYIYPQTRQTIEEVESNFEYCIRHHGVNGVLIDPFNQLSREFKDRDDQYLEEFLTSRKRFALNHKMNYVIVVHPKSLRKNKDGEYDPVDFYDLAGGAMWSNKADNYMVVHRPYQSAEPQNTAVDIIIKKIKKQRLVGIPGQISLSFRREENRYYYNQMGTPVSPLQMVNSGGEGRRDGHLKMTKP